MKAILIIIIAGLAFADPAPTAPIIPDKLQVEIALTALDAQTKAVEAKAAQDAAVAAVAKANAVCGEKFNVIRQGNMIVCAPKETDDKGR